MIGGLGATCFGSTEQALGVAALTARQLDLAVGHFAAAIRHNLALAHWPAVVSARLRLAETLALRARPGDLTAADRTPAAAGATRSHRPARPAPAGSGRRQTQRARSAAGSGREWRIVAAGPERAHRGQRRHAAPGRADREPAPGHSGGRPGRPASPRSRPRVPTPAGPARPGPQAIAEYRKRLRPARRRDRRAGVRGSSRSAARAHAERDWLAAQLTSAAGLAGRTRSFPDDGERARVAVSKAIRRALTRITDADPVIGEHLRQAVRTGTRCSYWPA